jgi:hypothetical protein
MNKIATSGSKDEECAAVSQHHCHNAFANIAQKHKLDKLAQKFHKHQHQSARKSFSQTDFNNGVTNFSNMTANEECGLVFLLICLAQFDEDWKLLNDALVSKQGT